MLIDTEKGRAEAIGGICFCQNPACELIFPAKYAIDDLDKFGAPTLPCGHPAKAIIMSAAHLRDMDEAYDLMLAGHVDGDNDDC